MLTRRKNTELPICHFRREQLPPQRYKLSNDSSFWSIVKTLHELFLICTTKYDMANLTLWGHLRSLPFSVEQTKSMICMKIKTFKACFTLLPVKNFHFRSPISHKNQTFLYLRNRNDLDGQGLTLWPLSSPYSHFSDSDHFPVNFHATLIMQQTFFICGFSPLYSGFLRSSSFLSSSSLCERLKIMKYDLFSLFPIYIRPWVRRDSLALKKEPLASLWIHDCPNQEKESAS